MVLEQEKRDWLTLTLIPGLGSAHFIRLLARFKSPGDVLNASRAALEEVVGRQVAERITQYADVADVDAQERAMAKYGVTLVTLEDPAYPLLLAEIYDPPLVLFVRGQMLNPDENCVGIVGTRRASPYGLRMAEKFGRELASRNITVVSGLAAGVDAAAHRGAMEAGGRTIAVLGCGVDVVYPRQNEALMERMCQEQTVVSQFFMGMGPIAGNFPYRNRIISGMSLGTLIVEAPRRSGALITAKQAAEQGREVFAIPGQIGVQNSEGPHLLIQEGAKLVQTVEDILVELELDQELRVSAAPAQQKESAPAPVSKPARPEPAPVRNEPQALRPPEPRPMPAQAAAPAPSGVEKAILGKLSANGSHVDEIAEACRISVSEALSSLTMLELKGLVRQFSGKRFAPR
ncbi:MAG: DNA-processing protein DprA [Candidatus Hydrogenedentes bacterium]|nr:DNA-processing protein DprA [Candidatus Hydrogenedentota bacterium]